MRRHPWSRGFQVSDLAHLGCERFVQATCGMSWLKALVVASLLAFSVEASAGGRVDWSDYIDHDAKPSTPRNSGNAAVTSEPAPVAPKKAKATKVSKKKVASKNRKARAKKSRRK